MSRFLSRFLVGIIAVSLLGTLILGAGQHVQAQAGEPLAPPQIPGEVVYVPFPVAIELDGNLDDWQNIPVQVITQGSAPNKTEGNDGPLSFSVAADDETLYLTMSIPDQNIITGQHGGNYWNEDSLEFYLNTSGDLNASGYGPGIFQVNINPGDIGNTDPAALTLSGTNSQQADVRAFVFETADGWAFEAAVPLRIDPAHGLEIGFQAQSNGASTQDRDVKLIWSNADASDNSWQFPYLFGRALFFEVGRTDIPTSSGPAAPPTPAPAPTPEPDRLRISVNQTGYYPFAPKHAVLASKFWNPLPWQLLDSQGNTLFQGETSEFGDDAASGESLQTIDFSAFTTPGTGYVLQVGEIRSDPFDISTDIYTDLKAQALAYFYLNRSGIPIEADYAPGAAWARGAGHLSDGEVGCFQGEDASGESWSDCGYTLDASGGWYDAGDYGKYVVNGGIAVWTLMNLYERSPDLFPDGSLSLPENQNGVPDVLDEARWELDFLLGMQVPAGEPLAGMAHHKLHGKSWDPLPLAPPETSTATSADGGRYLFPPSTPATLNLAATAAQCARIWEPLDADFSARCLAAAEAAWQAATANPRMAAVLFNAGGGAYGDNAFADEFYWAASELFITTGQDVYQEYLLRSPHFADTSGLYWGSTAALGTISLAVVANDLSTDEIEESRQSVIASADDFIRTLRGQGYLVPLAADSYVWGSNSDVLNRMMMMGLAYDFTQEEAYLDGMVESMDYLLGRNPLNKSYVSGYGENPLTYPHHRYWANELGFPPPPPGVVAGGPNGAPSDEATEAAGLTGNPPAKSYVDHVDSYSTNEVAINWNAPLAWSAAYLDQVASQVYAGPQAEAQPDVTPIPAATPLPDEETAQAPATDTEPTATRSPWMWIVWPLLLLAGGGLGIWFVRRNQ